MASLLLLGSGGREHALVWKLSKSDDVERVYVCPGNPGCWNEKKVIRIDLNVNDNVEIVKWCKENCIDFVVVGPELPLANGICDDLKADGVNCFGPSKKAAQLEASKKFAKSFMKRHNIPTARWESFTDSDEAKKHVLESNYPARVVKASGLAAGKGVIVATSTDEVIDAVNTILVNKTFGIAGDTIIIEEYLEGDEISVLAFSDGTRVSLMPTSQDHKRLEDGDQGPNTGGMGAYSPCNQIVTDATLHFIEQEIVQKTINAMQEENTPYIGVLYVGLMLTADGPKVLEYNCRFGDPEAEVLLPLLKSDLYRTLLACVDGNLNSALPEWCTDTFTVGIVMASQDYPSAGSKDQVIEGVDKVSDMRDVHVFHAGTKQVENKLFTNGGRILVVVAKGLSLTEAALHAQSTVKKISFPGAKYRSDIACKGIFNEVSNQQMTYTNAGVDVDEGDRLVENIKTLSQSTHRPGVLGSIGGFGGFFSLNAVKSYKEPILVSGTDGVGTKLKIAQAMNQHKSIGIDLVAMCVNDILTHGAEPLFFLDYFACSHLDRNVAQHVLEGIANGCKQAGCALIGGETAEMPGMYHNDEYDLAGFAVGAVEREDLILKPVISPNDVLVGLASSGLHSNGFSLIRKLIAREMLDFTSPAPFNTNTTLGEELLKPTKIYVTSLLPLLKNHSVKAVAHITGGGLIENLPRVLPKNLAVKMDAIKWHIPPIFSWITLLGVPIQELLRTFNCGIGMALIVSPELESYVVKTLNDSGEKAWTVGQVISKDTTTTQQVVVNNIKESLLKSLQSSNLANNLMEKVATAKRKVAVLISGTGTNLQALIDSTSSPFSTSKIVLVISNVPGVKGLERARDNNIPVKVIKHKDYKSRLDFDMAVHETLVAAGVEIVCLAGFMRILTGEFVRLWQGNLLNIHPSLLPSFPGINVHNRALEAGVRLSGCTVHFVVEEVDAGGIIAQEAVPVEPDDTEETLAERIKAAEHRVYPLALDLLSRRQVELSDNNKVIWAK